MAHEGLWPREYNRTGEAGVRTLAADDVLPRKSGRGRQATAAGSSGNGSYHLGLLFEAPMDGNNNTQQQQGTRRERCSSSPAFDFVCSSSGTTSEEGGQEVGFDRVCALRGEVVHIFTFFHAGAEEVGGSSSGEAGATTAAGKSSSVSLELGHPAECAAWNSTASCVVVGDASGRLHFVTAEGTLIFSQPLMTNLVRGGSNSDDDGSGGETTAKSPRAFSCIKFATSTDTRGAGEAAAAAAKAGEAADGCGQELLAFSASMQLYHFANVPIAAIRAACLAQDVGALKKLRAGIRVSVADASGEEESFPCPSSPEPSSRDKLPRTACLQTLQGGRSRVFLVSRGGVSVWARGPGRSVGRHPRRCGREIGAAAAKEGEEGGGGAGEEGGSDGGEVCVRSQADAPRATAAAGKLVRIDGVPAGKLFGGGGAISAELSADGRCIIVVDDRGGLSWWNSRSLLRLGRWSWPHGAAFHVTNFVVLASNLVDAGGGGGIGRAPVGGSGNNNSHGEDRRPCLACISREGEVRVLRLGAGGAEELHRVPPAAGAGMLTVPSPSRHQFLLITSDPASRKAGFHLVKEAVPRHRLQALLARGDFDRALELARANSMDETDVHAARLLALLSGAGGAASASGDGKGDAAVAGPGLSPRFFEDARALLDRLDSPGVLGRACEAAVRAVLPSLADVRKLLEVVENRLRSFDTAGARVRNMMLERLTGVLSRLRTFELIEGGRKSTLLVSATAATASSAAAAAAAAAASELAAVVPLSSALIRPPGDEDSSHAEDGDGEIAVARGGGGKENQGCGRDGGGDGSDDDDDDDGEGEDAHLGGTGRRSSSPGPVQSSLAGSEVGGGSPPTRDQHGGSGDTELSEVERWLQFRTADLVSFVGGALQAGDIQAAAVAWRRHGRTDRGAGRAAAAAAAAGGGGSGGEEGGRLMGVALPGQLASVPAGAPPLLLGGWLRDEVLPWLDAVEVVALGRGPRA
ncbi:unnamed protein product [Ectocarpus sp. 12 AP-2014]